jgi:protease IV
MSDRPDLLIDRRRLKRRLLFWRVLAIAAVVGCALLALGRGMVAVERAHLARLTVSGLITEDRKLSEAITGLTKDDMVKALIVYVDSPGGSVAGGETLHGAIQALAAKKPVVTVMGSTAASAGYMVSVPAARIFARNSTLTGSIGVLLPTGEVSGLLSRLGVDVDTITSGPLKDQPSLTRPLTPEGRDVLRGLVMDMYEQFVAMVADGRHMTPQQVRALADGRAYTGRQALKLGLIDAIGGEAEARAWLASERQVSVDLPVEDVRPHNGLVERTIGASLGGLLEVAVKSVLFQGVNLDGAWAVWQPSRPGD